MNEGVAVLAASAPAVLVAWGTTTRSRAFEPLAPVVIAFLLGILAAFTAVSVAALLGAWAPESVLGLSGPVRDALVFAALPEEVTKLALLLVACAIGARRVRGRAEGVAYGVAIAMGFAAAENTLFAARGGAGVLVMRTVTSLPLHAMIGLIAGYHVGRARETGRGLGARLAAALVFSVALHWLFDAPLYVFAHPDFAGSSRLLLALFLGACLTIGATASLHVLRSLRRADEEG